MIPATEPKEYNNRCVSIFDIDIIWSLTAYAVFEETDLTFVSFFPVHKVF